MANHWAITIGINQYRHLQPLMHAQNDALFTHRFLVEESGFPMDHCVLLSDLATSVGHQAMYPDKPALLEWVHAITQQVEEGDVVWFFFSGYGVQLEGKDYLMPIDGDPGQIASTGMAMTTLMESLAQLPTDNVLLLLDINRAQGSLSGQTIGKQVIDLAKAYRVATFLSCLPDQYSHETLGTRHGLFTATLLEALQQECKTIGQIGDYLTRRLPEISAHHWRPIQNPVILADDSQKSVVVVLDPDVIADATAASVPQAAVQPAERPAVEPSIPIPAEPISAEQFITEDSSVATDEISAGGLMLEPPLPPTVTTDGATNGLSESPFGSPDLDNGTVPEPALVQPPAHTDTIEMPLASERPDSDDDRSAVLLPRESAPREPASSGGSGARLRNWGLLALVLLGGVVLLKQPFIAAAWQDLTGRLSAVTANRETSSDSNEAATDDSTTAEPPADGSNSADSSVPAAETGLLPDGTATTSAETAAANGTPSEADQARGLIAQANAALAQSQYLEALIALQQVPQSQRNETFSSVLTQARAGAAEAQQANATLLTEARTAIQPIQAFQFTEAIAKARLIKSGEPYYEAAQEDIRAWSQIILDIAEGRATSGSLETAIAAARIMPYDNAQLYKKAQERIVFWQQRQRSQEIIAQAQAIPASGQASSYQKGIVELQEVPIEHPEYETAQRLADDWSERIFSIAQARAAQGRQQAAVQAAILVPAGTVAYEPAQQAIRRWQAGQ